MDDIGAFSGFNILPGQKVRVQAPVDALWSMTAISILPDEKTPENARVVVYAEAEVPEREEKQTIAIAALRMETQEIVNVEYTINCFTPLVLYTKGDDVTVSISGACSITDQAIIEVLEK